jgi:hypothetical protein
MYKNMKIKIENNSGVVTATGIIEILGKKVKLKRTGKTVSEALGNFLKYITS